MKRLIIIFAILLFAWPCWGATYYISQSGAGDGSAVGTPDSVADFNDGTFSYAAGSTIYFLGTITTTLDPPTNGSDGNNVILRGDYSGQECTLDAAGGTSFEMDLDLLDYYEIRGFIFNGDPDTCHLNIRRGGNFTVDDCVFNSPDSDVMGIRLFCTTNEENVTDLTITNNTFSNGDSLTTSTGIRGIFNGNGTSVPHTVTITDNTFTCTGYGIRQYTNDQVNRALNDTLPYGWTISDNVFTDQGGSAIKVYLKGTAANLISENIITNAGDDTTDTNAINCHYCRNTIIEKNEISGQLRNATDGGGIDVDWMHDAANDDLYYSDSVIVRENDIHDNTEGAGIVVYRGKDTQVYSNIFSGNEYGIKTNCHADGNCTGNLIYNNTIYGSSKEGIYVNADSDSPVFKNNIISNSGEWGLYDNSADDLTIDYNCWYNNTSGNVDNDAIGGNAVEADPKFVDAANDDFHLKVSSPAIDAGADLTATVLTDIDSQDADHANMDGDSDGAVTDMDIGADQVKFSLVITAAGTTEYVLLDGEDGNYAGVSLCASHTLKNYTIGRYKSGALRVNGNAAASNVACDDEVYIGANTLTAINCAFQESEVTVTGAGTLTDSNCLFSVTDFGFQDKSNGNFCLKRESVLVNKGYNTGASTDLASQTTPYQGTHDIGGYEHTRWGDCARHSDWYRGPSRTGTGMR